MSQSTEGINRSGPWVVVVGRGTHMQKTQHVRNVARTRVIASRRPHLPQALGIYAFVCNVDRLNCTINADKDRRLPANAPSDLDRTLQVQGQVYGRFHDAKCCQLRIGIAI